MWSDHRNREIVTIDDRFVRNDVEFFYNIHDAGISESMAFIERKWICKNKIKMINRSKHRSRK